MHNYITEFMEDIYCFIQLAMSKFMAEPERCLHAQYCSRQLQQGLQGLDFVCPEKLEVLILHCT